MKLKIKLLKELRDTYENYIENKESKKPTFLDAFNIVSLTNEDEDDNIDFFIKILRDIVNGSEELIDCQKAEVQTLIECAYEIYSEHKEIDNDF